MTGRRLARVFFCGMLAALAACGLKGDPVAPDAAEAAAAGPDVSGRVS